MSVRKQNRHFSIIAFPLPTLHFCWSLVHCCILSCSDLYHPSYSSPSLHVLLIWLGQKKKPGTYWNDAWTRVPRNKDFRIAGNRAGEIGRSLIILINDRANFGTKKIVSFTFVTDALLNFCPPGWPLHSTPLRSAPNRTHYWLSIKRSGSLTILESTKKFYKLH